MKQFILSTYQDFRGYAEYNLLITTNYYNSTAHSRYLAVSRYGYILGCDYLLPTVTTAIITVHHPARVTVVKLAKMAETGAPLRHVFPVFMC